MIKRHTSPASLHGYSYAALAAFVLGCSASAAPQADAASTSGAAGAQSLAGMLGTGAAGVSATPDAALDPSTDATAVGVITDGGAAIGDAATAKTDGALPDYEALMGWAGEVGDGLSTTTGGAAGRVVTATTAQQLIDYAASSEPLVIQVSGTLVVPKLQVNSNKTLVGMGSDAVVQGGIRIRGQSDAFVSNVILRNLRVDGATSDADGDAVQIYYAHHVWVDHCDIHDAPDGNLDIVHASSWVTVSWTRFHYTSAAPAPDHRFSNLIGHSDGNDEDVDRLKASFHHCHWADGVVERMPRVRYGAVHVWNSLFTARGNNYAIGAGLQSQLLVENNVFDTVNDPHVFYDDEPSAQIAASNNLYPGSTGRQDVGQGTAFAAPYTYPMHDAAEVAAAVTAGVGPH